MKKKLNPSINMRQLQEMSFIFLPKLYFIDFFKCTKTCSMFKVQCNTARVLSLGGAGGAMAPPVFGRSVNPISTKAGRLCPPYY